MVAGPCQPLHARWRALKGAQQRLARGRGNKRIFGRADHENALAGDQATGILLGLSYAHRGPTQAGEQPGQRARPDRPRITMIPAAKDHVLKRLGDSSEAMNQGDPPDLGVGAGGGKHEGRAEARPHEIDALRIHLGPGAKLVNEAPDPLDAPRENAAHFRPAGHKLPDPARITRPSVRVIERRQRDRRVDLHQIQDVGRILESSEKQDQRDTGLRRCAPRRLERGLEQGPVSER